MKTIRSKILVFFLLMLFLVACVIVALTYYHQQSIGKYNRILQRFLVMNEVSVFSRDALAELNEYIVSTDPAQIQEYEAVKSRLAQTKKKLETLKNEDNHMALTNYQHMIERQIEMMDLTLSSLDRRDRQYASQTLAEAVNISEFISEKTLSLIDRELQMYHRFYRRVIAQSNSLKQMELWTLSMSAIVLVWIGYRFSAGITRPVQELAKAAKNIARGDFEKEIRIRTKDEIAFLAHTFEQMRQNIRQLIHEMKQKAKLEKELRDHKLLLRESEIQNLQNQINPHFLFNTMNLIAKKAYLEGAGETNELVNSVSRLLRYNLKRFEQTVRLGDEIRILEEYLRIQQSRWTHRVTYELDIDERALRLKIPCLSLQPFVENVFVHVVEKSLRDCHIRIKVTDYEDRVAVIIEDNGTGMSEETLRALTDDRKKNASGIGIRNTVKRLRLFYGTEDVIDIRSEKKAGTRIGLTLPKTSDKGEYDETADRG